MKTLLFILLITLMACSKEYEMPNLDAMKETTENEKAAPSYDITGEWTLLTDDARASYPNINISWNKGKLYVNLTEEIDLTSPTSFFGNNPNRNLTGNMDDLQMTFTEIVTTQGGGSTHLTLIYVR